LLLALLGSGALAMPLAQSPRPQANPRAAMQTQSLDMPAEAAPISQAAIAVSLRPAPRPVSLNTSIPSSTSPAPAVRLAPVKGQLCGVAGIEGKPIAPISGAAKGCGLQDGVQVTAVSGIKLSIPAQVDCPTAKALKNWVDTGIVPSIGNTGGGVKRLEIAGSYACRPRNNQRGSKVSEHGRGRAVDLAGITLKDGRTLTVLQDWKRNPKIMQSIHRAACGTFGTVLGPKSDSFHRDHFHVDTARHQNGAYCR
jgi:hypothetical protein